MWGMVLSPSLFPSWIEMIVVHVFSLAKEVFHHSLLKVGDVWFQASKDRFLLKNLKQTKKQKTRKTDYILINLLDNCNPHTRPEERKQIK